MKENEMTCHECDRDASLRQVGGLKGPPSEGKVPLCQVHYAKWLFSKPDVRENGGACVGEGVCYIPAELTPDIDGDKLFDVFVDIPPGSRIGKQLPDGYLDDLEHVEDELFGEVTGVNYDGDEPVGYVVVDTTAEDEYFQTWGVFSEHSVTGEATPAVA